MDMLADVSAMWRSRSSAGTCDLEGALGRESFDVSLVFVVFFLYLREHSAKGTLFILVPELIALSSTVTPLNPTRG